MSKDVSKILEGWDYEPDQVLVRVVKGEDGREKIQLRVDLGLLQMETSGRPDGQRPKGRESWLEYYEEQQRAHDEAHPDAAAFQLDDEACARLWREGVQYYHRYLSFWHLEQYERCAQDTERNLRLFAFVRGHAQGERNRMQFDEWRPYVTMMYTRSVGTPLVEQGKYADALQVIGTGIDAIQAFFDEHGQGEGADECVELANLEQWRDEILLEDERAAEARPESAMEVLRRKLGDAVGAEEFEQAARLRDEIRRLSASD